MCQKCLGVAKEGLLHEEGWLCEQGTHDDDWMPVGFKILSGGVMLFWFIS